MSRYPLPPQPPSYDLAAFEARVEAFDAAVAASDDVDGFCSSSAWILPAHSAFHPEEEPLLFETAAGFVALARARSQSIGRYYAPLEAMWGLATPMVGERPERLAVDAAARLVALRHRWDALWLCGLHQSSALFNALGASFGRRYRLGLGPTARRHVASLDGGFDGFMGRRSAKFRANLRRATRRAHDAGVSYRAWEPDRHALEGEETPTAPPSVTAAEFYQRILAIERRSWKGLTEQGINAGSMLVFYDKMMSRIGPNRSLRAVIAQRDGEDVGYVFGALFGDTFRGLQMSFDERLRRLSLGNVMQGEMVRRLADEGVCHYDLGSDIEYKMRWAEGGLVTVTLVVLG